MKKIYVLMLSLCVAIAANAAASQLWIFGSDQQIGAWNLANKAEMTKVSDGVFDSH